MAIRTGSVYSEGSGPEKRSPAPFSPVLPEKGAGLLFSLVKPSPVHSIVAANVAQLSRQDSRMARRLVRIGHKGSHLLGQVSQIPDGGHARDVGRGQFRPAVPQAEPVAIV